MLTLHIEVRIRFALVMRRICSAVCKAYLGQGRETNDAILAIGLKLWQGAEAWIDPEIDQGFGLANTHGIAGFSSGDAYKLGFSYPYARVNRYFVRQVINLGGDTEKVDADFNQFEASQTANRIVLTVGKFYQMDIFDTNKYANNPKSDFLRALFFARLIRIGVLVR